MVDGRGAKGVLWEDGRKREGRENAKIMDLPDPPRGPWLRMMCVSVGKSTAQRLPSLAVTVVWSLAVLACTCFAANGSVGAVAIGCGGIEGGVVEAAMRSTAALAPPTSPRAQPAAPISRVASSRRHVRTRKCRRWCRVRARLVRSEVEEGVRCEVVPPGWSGQERFSPSRLPPPPR